MHRSFDSPSSRCAGLGLRSGWQILSVSSMRLTVASREIFPHRKRRDARRVPPINPQTSSISDGNRSCVRRRRLSDCRRRRSHRRRSRRSCVRNQRVRRQMNRRRMNRETGPLPFWASAAKAACESLVRFHAEPERSRAAIFPAEPRPVWFGPVPACAEFQPAACEPARVMAAQPVC